MKGTRSPIKENEIKFCEYWKTNVLPNKNHITPGMLSTASGFLGIKISGGCSTCMRNDAINLNNKFQLLYPIYLEYISFQKSLDMINENNI